MISFLDKEFAAQVNVNFCKVLPQYSDYTCTLETSIEKFNDLSLKAKQLWRDELSAIALQGYNKEIESKHLELFLQGDIIQFLSVVKTPEQDIKDLLDWTLSQRQQKYNKFCTHLMACLWSHYYSGMEKRANE